MPPGSSGQHDYYTSRQRRPSQHSINGPAEQARVPSSPDPSLTRSEMFLPASTYVDPSAQQRHQHLNVSTNVQRNMSGLHNNGSDNFNLSEDASPDPHEFYRQYQDPFAEATVSSLSQNSLVVNGRDIGTPQTSGRRNTSFSSANSNGSSGGIAEPKLRPRQESFQRNQQAYYESSSADAARSTPVLSNSPWASKKSIKDLVAKFDASSGDEMPPMPSATASRTTSRNVSPVLQFDRSVYSLNGAGGFATQQFRSKPVEPSARPSEPLIASNSGNSAGHSQPLLDSHPNSAASQSLTNLNHLNPPRRPLFGEVTHSAGGGMSAAYGIPHLRRRRGSEGSPMHSPNPMFPSATIRTNVRRSPIFQQSWGDSHSADNRDMHEIQTQGQITSSRHRSQSDFSGDSIRTPTRMNFDQSRLGSSGLHSQSHVPIGERPSSRASDSKYSALSSHADSKAVHHPTNARTSPALTRSPKHATRRGKPRSPIKSPSHRIRGLLIPSTEKSPSLRANIIAPPPIVSPPLRSSRPRLPVSSASTAASRAKMAEKFNSMQKQNNEKRNAARRQNKLPELDDINLEARRLRITQALSRSVKGREPRDGLPVQSREQAKTTPETSDSYLSSSPGDREDSSSASVPEVFVDSSTLEEDAGEEDFLTPVEELTPTGHGFDSIVAKCGPDEPHNDPADVDSPILGNQDQATSGITSRLVIPNPDFRLGTEPNSAVTVNTVDTDTTMIEEEPQSELTRPRAPQRSVLSQVMRMRSKSPQTPEQPESPQSDDQSDRADQESIQILLRNTAYVDDGAEFEQRNFERPNDSHLLYNERSSWTSSIEEQSPESSRLEGTTEATPNPEDSQEILERREQVHSSRFRDASTPVIRSNEAGRRSAYETIYLVLQQHSNSGHVMDNEIEDMYRRILDESPHLAEQEYPDVEKVQRLCLEELEKTTIRSSSLGQEKYYDPFRSSVYGLEDLADFRDRLAGSPRPEVKDERLKPKIKSESSRASKSVFGGNSSHRHKASLDSVEDWANTSPSVGWMQYVPSNKEVRPEHTTAHAPTPLRNDETHHSVLTSQDISHERDNSMETSESGLGLTIRPQSPTHQRSLDSPSTQPPQYPPPPPPSFPTLTPDSSDIPASSNLNLKGLASARPAPQIPSRSSSMTNMRNTGTPDPMSEGRPSLDQPSFVASSIGSSPTPEQRKLKRRRNVIKELLETESRYRSDMQILWDIYKETAASCPALTRDDVRVLFGNSDEVLQFSSDFLGVLKQAAKPIYIIPTSERYRNKKDTADSSSTRVSMANSEAPSLVTEFETPDIDRDRLTNIGDAFIAKLSHMDGVYSEYLKNHDAANKKLINVQSRPGVDTWLSECKKASRDITQAWDLDSLLVKPVQRLVKYPLLLAELIEATPEDHPDIPRLREALSRVTGLTARINEDKKHAERLGEALNGRKRKDSDARIGLPKAFGRGAEKIKQKAGISETYEDPEYNQAKHLFLENTSNIFIVMNDAIRYRHDMERLVAGMIAIAKAGDEWVDVKPTNYSEMESRLRLYSKEVRGLVGYALPDHLEKMRRGVHDPLDSAFRMLEAFQRDPKGVLQKRDKKLIDYAKLKNSRDRGDKLDRKTIERLEQWEALNKEAKDRMLKFVSLTGELARACLGRYIQLHMEWLDLCQSKLSHVIGLRDADLDEINETRLVRAALLQVERDWKMDFEHFDGIVLSLGICNGSLLADAANMLGFLTPSTLQNGTDSPRHPSWGSNRNKKRSTSLNSASPRVLGIDSSKRLSGNFGPLALPDNILDPSHYSLSGSRPGPPSIASGRAQHTPDMSIGNNSFSTHSISSPEMTRPGTSPAFGSERSPHVPQLNIDAPTPTTPFAEDSPALRPASSSTFYSASRAPSAPIPIPPSRGSGIFSSAVPMSESPPVGDDIADDDRHYDVLFAAASVYEFNIDRARREANFPYLTYVAGEIFDVIGEKGELWLARNQDDANKQIGWIWNKHFAKLQS